MLSTNCSLSARFQWSKTQYSLISDSLCTTFYISEAYNSSKQVFLSFVANFIPVKLGVEPMLSLNRRSRKKTCSAGCNFGFSATCGGIDYFFFYTLSVFFPLVTKFQSVFFFYMKMLLSSLFSGAKPWNWVLSPSLLYWWKILFSHSPKGLLQVPSRSYALLSQTMNLLVYMCSRGSTLSSAGGCWLSSLGKPLGTS